MRLSQILCKVLNRPPKWYIIKISTKEDVSVYKSIESDFFKNLIADILRFFETGEVSFDVEQTLKVMQIREAIIKAMGTPGEMIEL